MININVKFNHFRRKPQNLTPPVSDSSGSGHSPPSNIQLHSSSNGSPLGSSALKSSPGGGGGGQSQRGLKRPSSQSPNGVAANHAAATGQPLSHSYSCLQISSVRLTELPIDIPWLVDTGFIDLFGFISLALHPFGSGVDCACVFVYEFPNLSQSFYPRQEGGMKRRRK